MRINNTLYYILKDHLGSASVVTDASGTEVGEQRYYPFGETRLTTGTIYTDKLFTGQREMTGLGIYHYQARFYSPKLGRFLSPDTIVPNYANPQSLNRFSYVYNAPLNYIDPSGHDAWWCTSNQCLENYVQTQRTQARARSEHAARNRRPTSTPTPTPTPAPLATQCFIVFNECSHPSATSTPIPTITTTPTPTGCNPQIANCIYPTPTPFAQELVPVVEEGLQIINPFNVGYEPDVATWFWDTLLRAAPVLGLPASSLDQVVTTVVRTTVNAGAHVVRAAANAAISVSNAIGTATNNIARSVSTAFKTGVGGPTLPIFFHPSNFQSPLSYPTATN